MEDCFAVVLKKLLPKHKDLGYFTISYTIGNSHFENALNLVCKNPQPTNISLHLVDRTIIHPSSTIEDILVKVRKLCHHKHGGRQYGSNDFRPPFFATRRAVIDVEKGKLTLRLGKEIKFTVFNSNKISSPHVSCNCVEALDNSNRAISCNYKKKSYLETLENPKSYKELVKKWHEKYKWQQRPN
ncbi:hypothetical protein CR513_39383, partial [Mucuna pruriens]